MKILLVLIGWLLCVPAILLGPIVKLFPITIDRPWVDGLLLNTLRAYKKYNTRSWIRRMIGIVHNPRITLQYLSILCNKEQVEAIGSKQVYVNVLCRLHDVQTTHKHHKDRVEQARKGNVPDSIFGKIIVVGNKVHDGNHRIEALKEAGYIGPICVEYWRKINKETEK